MPRPSLEHSRKVLYCRATLGSIFVLKLSQDSDFVLLFVSLIPARDIWKEGTLLEKTPLFNWAYNLICEAFLD